MLPATRLTGVLGLVGALVGALAGAAQRPPVDSRRPTVPSVDHHQHLFSPDLATLLAETPPVVQTTPRTAADLVAQLDAAGIARAVVLSTAYIFDQPSRAVDASADRVRKDNDWTAAQVDRFPDRLVGFCGLNPLKAYALEELARCAGVPSLRRGLKLHFGNAAVDYHDAAQIAQVRRVFQAANDHGMAIVVHLRASVTQGMAYGRAEALVFLNDLLPAAPDVVVQVAHLAGAGSWQDEGVKEAATVFADAIAQSDPRTRRLYFDVTALGAPATSEDAQWWAATIRRIGLERIVFGSDATLPNVSPGEAWRLLTELLPLRDEEFSAIAANVAPYMN